MRQIILARVVGGGLLAGLIMNISLLPSIGFPEAGSVGRERTGHGR